ncbi:MAG: 2-dehydropantoate 2-reductase N-terminal domain-containing protein, partial [Planctomycetaceae bacterium]
MGEKATILGGGAMATACSILLAEHAGQDVSLWARTPEHAADMQADRENRRLLPGVPIPDSVHVTSDVAEAVDGATCLVAAIPTKYLRSALAAIAPQLTHDRPVVSVIKGLER